MTVQELRDALAIADPTTLVIYRNIYGDLEDITACYYNNYTDEGIPSHIMLESDSSDAEV